jgi:hypothetical protein
MDSGPAPSGASRNDENKNSSIINKTARRANHFGFSEAVSSRELKNISLSPSGKSAA